MVGAELIRQSGLKIEVVLKFISHHEYDVSLVYLLLFASIGTSNKTNLNQNKHCKRLMSHYLRKPLWSNVHIMRSSKPKVNHPSSGCFQLGFIMEFSNSPPALMSDAARTQKVPHGNHRWLQFINSCGEYFARNALGTCSWNLPQKQKRTRKNCKT